MESIYALSIKGTMLYVKGNLSEQECIAVEKIARHFQNINKNSIDYETVCKSFIDEVEATLHISLVQVPIKWVFRIE